MISEVDTTLQKVDAIDEQIVTLLLERATLAYEAQRSHIADGGSRTQLSRENLVIARYGRTLGNPGVQMALQILRMGRHRPADDRPGVPAATP